MTIEPLVYTIAEVSVLLHASRRTVERLVATGEIRSVLIGRRRLVKAEEVDRYLRIAERRGRTV